LGGFKCHVRISCV